MPSPPYVRKVVYAPAGSAADAGARSGAFWKAGAGAPFRTKVSTMKRVAARILGDVWDDAGPASNLLISRSINSLRACFLTISDSMLYFRRQEGFLEQDHRDRSRYDQLRGRHHGG